MEVATTREDRLALIKKIAERRRGMAKVRKQSAKVMKAVQPKKKAEIEVPKESNMYAWTDASRYAKEYYGDTLYHTTKFDNDWD